MVIVKAVKRDGCRGKGKLRGRPSSKVQHTKKPSVWLHLTTPLVQLGPTRTLCDLCCPTLTISATADTQITAHTHFKRFQSHHPKRNHHGKKGVAWGRIWTPTSTQTVGIQTYAHNLRVGNPDCFSSSEERRKIGAWAVRETHPEH